MALSSSSFSWLIVAIFLAFLSVEYLSRPRITTTTSVADPAESSSQPLSRSLGGGNGGKSHDGHEKSKPASVQPPPSVIALGDKKAAKEAEKAAAKSTKKEQQKEPREENNKKNDKKDEHNKGESKASKKHNDAHATGERESDETVTAVGSDEDPSHTLMGDSHYQAPNIVFILADDLGWNSIGYQDYDLSFATPHLTSLARDGLILSNYYSQEVCTPARAALLTGRYPLSIGMQFSVVDTRTPWGLNLGEQTIADVLSEHGYVTRALGKWHLGHHSPKFLPTARGFDSFVGFLNGDNHYYSKRNPIFPHFTDFIGMDRECYYPYTEYDMHNYSTHFYRTKAIDVIHNHDQSVPLFLYLPFQAVHDPFTDAVEGHNAARNFVSDEIRDAIDSQVVGHKRTDYAYALNLLDGAVGGIVQALEESGMMDNTYVIFASDNGGCNMAGGKNGPLRGTKGSLLEGGTKVDAFVYGPKLLSSSALSGSQFNGLFHVTDWFPTMLAMAGIDDHVPRSGFELDGVNQLDAWTNGQPVRTQMLYNSFHDVKKKNFNYMTNGSIAVRNEQYKLIHFFDAADYAGWYDPSVISADDDAPNTAECGTTTFNYFNGKFVFGLYDLINDPYEENNLYDDPSEAIQTVKMELYALAEQYHAKAKPDVIKLLSESKTASVAWQNAGGYIVPYVKAAEVDAYMGVETSYQTNHPEFCRPAHLPRLTDDYVLADSMGDDGAVPEREQRVGVIGRAAVKLTNAATSTVGFALGSSLFFLTHLVLISVLSLCICGTVYCGGGCGGKTATSQ